MFYIIPIIYFFFYSNDSFPIESDIKWGQYILNNTELVYIELDTDSKALRKKMEISEEQSFIIKKAKKKYSGIYNCYVNDTINNVNYNLTYMLEGKLIRNVFFL